MLMVIFGAGASYDSSPDFPPPSIPAAQQNDGNSPAQSLSREQWRPPLANALFCNPHHAFSHIVKKYPKLTHVLPYLRAPSQNRSVEEVLESLQDQSKDYPERLRELTSIQYYLRDLLFEITNKWLAETDGVTNYALLVGELLRLNRNDEPIFLVTFNYDLLLDHALQSFSYKFREPADQSHAHRILRLFKPHGSVNWARTLNLSPGNKLNPEGVIEEAHTIELTRHFVLATDLNWADKNPNGKTLIPAIAIPVQNKSDETYACPQQHLNELKAALPSVTKILIIGWQAREAHFTKLLRVSGLPRVSQVMVVGSSPSKAATTLEHFTESTALVREASIDYGAFGRGIFNFRRDRILDLMPETGAVDISVAPGGFSDFALNHRVIDFLNA